MDADDAQRTLESFLDDLPDSYQLEWISEESRIPEPIPGWAFAAKRLIPGAFGEGNVEHGFMSWSGDIDFDG